MRSAQKFASLLTIILLMSCSSSNQPLMELPPPQQEVMFVDEAASDAPMQVLVFSKTTGFRHKSIEAGIEAVKQLGEAHGFVVDATEDGAWFTPENLRKYDAVIFMNTNGIDVLNAEQKAAFEGYIQRDGGFVGVHSAAATGYEWPWYGKLVGAWFDKHPKPQHAEVQVLDKNHPSMAHLPARWERFDEWYNYRSNPRDSVHILAVLNEKSYEGGTMAFDHPIVWAHEYEGGRAWYTALGHTEEAYADADFRMHLLGGIEWAAGKVEGNVDATLSSSYRKVVLMDEVTDPMEIDIADDGRVFLAERAGALKMWDPKTKKTTSVGWIPVFKVIEDGLLGLALGNDFLENGWLYTYYAPVDNGPSRLSRFTMVDDQLDLESEKILLEINVQRELCCHMGGGLTMDDAGNLYLSLGENSNPDRNGSPMDERPGHELGDTQRSSGNTNDLRGKVLRIHPEPDGTYTIPEGNLFPGDDLHRPEIYTMGHRNPFRTSIDPKTGWLYIGDEGSGDPINERGGWGWEEINQVRSAGNYGWPYFAGNNQPYNDYDYETEVVGDPFDPAAPVNDSPNNTGARELPPARPALIWYTYGVTEDFPTLGTGGVNPMAGPVFRSNPNHGPTALPAYFEGSFLMYEWMRNWVKEVKFDENGDLLAINPFLPGIEFLRPMDMELGPDGAIYVAEWGDGYWGSNATAQVVRIEYVGNNPPEEVTPLPQSIRPNLVSIDAPIDGSFFTFDEPIDYQVSVTDVNGNPLGNLPVSIKTYTGFDTHRIMLDQQNERAGQTTITREYTHKPDLHFVDRFAEIEACVSNKNGLEVCDTVKLHPHHKEAEHYSSIENATRQIYSATPTSVPYALTALSTIQVENGSVLTYAPINLAGISALTVRLKHYEPGALIVRANTAEGPVLGQLDLESKDMVAIPKTPQGEFIDQATEYDQVLRRVDRAVYADWSEATLQLAESDDVQALVITFEGEAGKTLAELDWLRFE